MELFPELEGLTDRIFSIASKANTKDFHSHQVGQLSVPKNGIMYITVEDKLYLVPTHRAIFIPKNTKHCVYKTGCHTIIENIYFQDNSFPILPDTVKIFQLSVLATCLITRLCQTSKENLSSLKTTHVLAVLLDELIEGKQPLSYEIIMPQNEDLVTVFNHMMTVRDALPSLEDCAKLVHLSSRTLQRKIKQELNIHFILWRQQIIFAKALALLAVHKKTAMVAYKLGYNSESAFISMFKKMSGEKRPSDLFILTQDPGVIKR